jgi:hypothetical protein
MRDAACVRAAAGRAHRDVAVLQDLADEDSHRPARGHTPLPLNVGDRLCIATGDFRRRAGPISTTFAGPSVRLACPLPRGRASNCESMPPTDPRFDTVVEVDAGRAKGINARECRCRRRRDHAEGCRDPVGLSIGVDMGTPRTVDRGRRAS